MAHRYICCSLIDSQHSKDAIEAIICGLKLNGQDVIAQYPETQLPIFQPDDILIIWAGGYHTAQSRTMVQTAQKAGARIVTLDHSWFDTLRGEQYSLSVDTPYPPVPANINGYPLDRWQAMGLPLHQQRRKNYPFTPRVMRINPTDRSRDWLRVALGEWEAEAENAFERYAPRDVPLYTRERNNPKPLLEELENATLGLITFNSRAAIEALRLDLWVWAHPKGSIWPHWVKAHGGCIKSRKKLFAYLAHQQGTLEEFANDGFASQLIERQMDLLKYNATARLVA